MSGATSLRQHHKRRLHVTVQHSDSSGATTSAMPCRVWIRAIYSISEACAVDALFIVGAGDILEDNVGDGAVW